MSRGLKRGEDVKLVKHGPVLYARQCDKNGRMNINGPTVMTAPPWLPGRLANFYLYFSQHRGNSIWLAVSDQMQGPWRMVPRPVLNLEATTYTDHIASPDVVIDEERLEVRMYFHGGHGTELAQQGECLAVSRDGVTYSVVGHDIGSPYWRVFRHGGWWYALVMPGTIMRSVDGVRCFEPGESVLPETARHSAVVVKNDRAFVFYSQLGASPEAIMMRVVELTQWGGWQVGEAQTVLQPEEAYEGGSLPSRPAEPGEALSAARELRDPAACLGDGRVNLFYVAGGERCIALASGQLDHRSGAVTE